MVIAAAAQRRACGALFAGLLLGAACGPLRAAEPLAADRQAQITALHQVFVQQRDLWSALQVESYARARGLALPPMLGEARIYGDPLWAFPMFVNRRWEGASWVVVWAYDHLHLLGSDGCPVTRSRALDPIPEGMGMSRYGGHLAALGRRAAGTWQLSVTRTVEGREVWHCDFPAQPGDALFSDPMLADDGSAALVTISRQAGGRSQPLLMVCDAQGARPVPGEHTPLGIAGKGGWMALWNPASGRSELHRPGQEPAPYRAICCGGGCAVCVDQLNGIDVARPDGTIAHLSPPFALGQNPGVIAAGEWLMVGCDLDVGPRTAFYRWAELGADPQAPPARVVTGRCAPSSRDPGALWLFNGSDLAVVDCARENLGVTPFCRAPAPIENVNDTFERCVVRYQGGLLVCDDAGAELWRGGVDGWTMLTGDLLDVVRRDAGGQNHHLLVHLQRDPAKRTEQPLALDQREWRLAFDVTHGRVAAICGDATRLFDPASGRDDTPPGALGNYDLLQERPGRRTVDLARLMARGYPQWAVPGHLLSKDAWRVGKDLYVSTSYSHLLRIAADGAWTDLGNSGNGARFGFDGHGRLALAGHASAYATSIVPTPDGRVAFKREPGEVFNEPPSDSWQVDLPTLRFTIPGRKAQRWDDAVGFRPICMRAPPGGGLLAITESVVIELTPASAALVGAAERP